MRRMWVRDLRNGLLFISLWIAGFLAFTCYPILASLYYSFTDFNIVSPEGPQWVGLLNIREMLFEDYLFWISLYNTAYFAFGFLFTATLFDVAIAVLLNLDIRARSFYRTVYFLPVLVPSVAAAIVWVWVLNPQRGLLNHLLSLVGIPGPNWLASVEWVKPALVLMAVWHSGRAIIIYLAGLQEIPRHLYEAARIDGANALQLLRFVTLPLLSPVIFFNVVVGLIGAFQYFTEAYIMTRGGPANASMFYSLHLYFQAFENLRMGYASSLAWCLFLIILLLTLLTFQFSRRLVHYER